MMIREGLIERGIRIVLTLGMLLMVSGGGMCGAGYGFGTGENAGDAGHGLAAGGNEENAGSGSGAEKSTGMAGATVSHDGSKTGNAGRGTADSVWKKKTEAFSTENLGARTAGATLTQDEPEVGLQGNVLTYGGLCVAFPEEIEPERIEAQDNGNIFDNGRFLSDGSKGRILDLCGAQEVYADQVGGDGIEVYLALPLRVRLMHYRAIYESETALLCALFDLLPEEMKGCTDTPMALWVEAYEGKNIVHVFHMTGLADYRIAGYLVDESDYSTVYEIGVDASYRVEQERR